MGRLMLGMFGRDYGREEYKEMFVKNYHFQILENWHF